MESHPSVCIVHKYIHTQDVTLVFIACDKTVKGHVLTGVDFLQKLCVAHILFALRKLVTENCYLSFCLSGRFKSFKAGQYNSATKANSLRLTMVGSCKAFYEKGSRFIKSDVKVSSSRYTARRDNQRSGTAIG